MQYSFLSSCLLALASTRLALAQTAGFAPITKPTRDEAVPAGSPYTITWQPIGAAGKVSLILLQGATQSTLQLGETIASAIDSTAGQFVWTIPSTSSFAMYGIKLQLDSDPTTFQYSNPFSIAGSKGVSSSASSTITKQTSEVSTIVPSTSTVPVSTVPVSSTLVTSSVAAPPTVYPAPPTNGYNGTNVVLTPSGTAAGTPGSAGTIVPTASASSTLTKVTVGAAPKTVAAGGMMGFAALAIALFL